MRKREGSSPSSRTSCKNGDPDILIRKLNPKEDNQDLQSVLEDAPRYSLNVSGKTQTPNAAEEVFSSVPDSFPAKGKFVFGIEQNNTLIGCIDVLRGFPKSETAMLGLLLLRESYQGKGFGRQAYLQLEDILHDWPEINTVRICVVESNIRVLGFWKKLGFFDTGIRRPYNKGIISSQVIILEKMLQ